MDLPTYTSIWRIEKRLYKLYDFRLPMPLPIGQIAVFAAIAVPYVVILEVLGLPFNHTLIWLYILPPGALTWLATRPVLEGKRLPELISSQLRYLAEPRVWCRMAPSSERDVMLVSARVWRAGATRGPARRPARATKITKEARPKSVVTARHQPAETTARQPAAGATSARPAWPQAGPDSGWAAWRSSSRLQATRASAGEALSRAEEQGGRQYAAPVRLGGETLVAGFVRSGFASAAFAGQGAPAAEFAGQRAPAGEFTGPETAQPEFTEPGAAAPEFCEPAAAEPDAAEPDARESEIVAESDVPAAAPESEASEPDGSDAQGVEPAAVEPEASESGIVSELEVSEPECTEQEAAEPDAAETDSPGPRSRPAITVVGPAPQQLRAPAVERALAGPSARRGEVRPGRVTVVAGGHRPGRPDQLGRDRERARLPIGDHSRIVVLGCTVGAGQTVTALLTGDVLASLRQDRVAVLDLNPGPGSLKRRAQVRPALSQAGSLAPSRLAVLTSAAPQPGGANGETRVSAAPGPAQAVKAFELAALRHDVVIADPSTAAVQQLLTVADQLVLVAPASAAAASAITMTYEWLEAHGQAGLGARAIMVLNGVSRRSVSHVEHAERICAGRCRATVRVPWDDQLNDQGVKRAYLTAPGSPPRKRWAGLLSPSTVAAYTALAGVTVASLAESGGPAQPDLQPVRAGQAIHIGLGR